MIAFLAKADVALSVTMTCCSTLLSPLLTPLAMKVLAGRFVEIDVAKMMFEILKAVIVPIAAGGFVHWLFKGIFDRHKAVCDRVLSVLSMTGICYTILALTAPSRDTFASAGVLIIIAAIVHNTVGYASGYWLARLVGRFYAECASATNTAKNGSRSAPKTEVEVRQKRKFAIDVKRGM